MRILISFYSWFIGITFFTFILWTTLFCSFLFRPETYDPWMKKLLRILFKILFVKVEVEGSEKIEQNKAYLLMCNHVSFFDIPLFGGYIPTFFRSIEAEWQHKLPLYGWVLRRYGNITIKRENIHSSIRSIREAENFIRGGKSLLILPEAHRTPDGNLQPFKKLPFFLAKRVEVDLVPIGTTGLYHLMRKGTWHIRPTTIKIKFGTIIPAEKVKSLSAMELRDLTWKEIQGLIENP
ncbi:MAG: 1-acyl-sn-glycerol-3-phosphate acyltransferase [Candidatus Aminicenantes bacterium]|nr:MAG: 1-acyl-sn-glycerol-3-phosphate acyltransferase [Candidatus Aminicenantes bacterium]